MRFLLAEIASARLDQVVVAASRSSFGLRAAPTIAAPTQPGFRLRSSGRANRRATLSSAGDALRPNCGRASRETDDATRETAIRPAPKARQKRSSRVIHRIDQLIDERHFAPVVHKPMRPQRAHGIEKHDHETGQIGLHQESHRQDAAPDRKRQPWDCARPQSSDQEHGNRRTKQKAAKFLNPPDPEHVAGRQRPNVRRIHHQRRKPSMDQSPHRRDEPRQRRQKQKSQHHDPRNEKLLRQIKQNMPRRLLAERQIFAIRFRAVKLATMVV